LLMCVPQMSLAGLWISRSVRPIFTGCRENLMNYCPEGTPSGQERIGVF
jgi:hypothetical protein